MNQTVHRTTPELGLTTAEAQLRLRQHGPNVLPESRPVPLWRRLIDQFRSPLIYILLFALGIDLAIWFVEGHSGWPVESFAIDLHCVLALRKPAHHLGKTPIPNYQPEPDRQETSASCVCTAVQALHLMR